MKNKSILSSLVAFCLLLSSFTLLKGQHKYIEQHRPYAEELATQYGIPEAVILAIAFIETGGGSSKHARISNNHFGIVGKNEYMKSRYRSFGSAKESFEAFCKMVSRKRFYPNLKGKSDVNAWIQSLADAGYSTRPNEWKRRVSKVIQSKFFSN